MAHWHVLWSCSASTRVVLPGRLDGVYLMTKDPKVLVEKRVNHNGQRFVLFWDGSVKSFDDVQFDRLKRDGLSMRRIASRPQRIRTPNEGAVAKQVGADGSPPAEG